MKHPTLVMALLLAVAVAAAAGAAETCSYARLEKSERSPGPWLNQDNWLAAENLRYGLQSANAFMPLVTLKSRAAPLPLNAAPRQIDFERIAATDPLDRQPRDLGFLLDTRIYADALLVLRNGRVVGERYWHGVSPRQPRLLLGASRPLLSLLGAMAVAQGKLATDRSVLRYVPELAAQTSLRKLSLQRLLDASSHFDWSAQEIEEWQAASGWRSGETGTAGVRAWLGKPERWEKGYAESSGNPVNGGPEGDLLTWALANAYAAPLSRVFCDNLAGRLRPENPVFWLTDAHGQELGDGLALSLRDFARVGQMLIDARSGGPRSRIPGWLIETLGSTGALRKNASDGLPGLGKGSELRYGFVHLGGSANRIALIGPYGNSLYVDLDQRLVIALFAAYPQTSSPALLATLAELWDRVAAASQTNTPR